MLQLPMNGKEAEFSLSMNSVAADVNRLPIFPAKIKADSHRLLRFRGSMREVSFRGVLSPLLRRGERDKSPIRVNS